VAGEWHWVAGPAAGDLRVGVTTSRRDLTTSTVIVCDRRALLVDPGWEPDELAWIAGDLAAAGIEVTAGFATHAHHDHLLWHPALGDAPRWAAPAAAALAAADRATLITSLGLDWPDELADLVGRVAGVPAAAGGIVPWPGSEVRMITHDAHSAGHTALWIGAAQVLLAGDMLSDVELPLLETSTPAAYLAGLAALLRYVERARVVVPGHGRPAVGGPAARARWDADRQYLDALLAGRDPQDQRQHNPGMPAAHRDNLARVAASAPAAGTADPAADLS